jgi:hypothetical protein
MATVTRVVGNKEGNGEDARGGVMMVAMGHGLCVLFDQISHYHYYYTNSSWVDFLPSPVTDKYQMKKHNHL